MTDCIILGIDPGSNVTGYGIVHINNNKASLITAGVLNVASTEDHFTRLQSIFNSVVSLIDEFHPDQFAVEEPFYGKNVQSMLKLGRAQGVAIAAALHKNLPVTGYSPRKIKQSITGSGNASKEQVAAMLQRLLDFNHTLTYFDATDALAVAMCHYYQGKNTISGKQKFTGWKSYLQQNPERLS
jgi:crossover junction endodeoxyribonuclease RuvC